ncbi:hypothetical protein K7432_001258 [Basidiobolus ranarum]|uniref:Uncharacterized protein n=1 Tax=Basidiobolus ranarum TaxID=34480 RepID=A0ABR2X369_9FUNG
MHRTYNMLKRVTISTKRKPIHYLNIYPYLSAKTPSRFQSQTTTPVDTFQQWKSTSLSQVNVETDIITPSICQLMALVLNRKNISLPEAGTLLPPNWHLAFFPPRYRQEDLSSDGYEACFRPPEPFRRRMWASGALHLVDSNPITVGQKVTMTTKCQDISVLNGSQGETVLVTLEKDLTNEHGLSAKDVRCLAYMRAPEHTNNNETRGIKARRQPDFSKIINPTSVMIFRYSALTFNTHLIHYDHNYAKNIEKYPACLVQGPLTTTLLLELLGENLPSNKYIKLFTYRALHPMYVNEPFTICGKQSNCGESYELWAVNQHGHLTMKGTSEIGTVV